jgi:hypothetical protein
MGTLWFVNYSKDRKDRALECKVFYRKRDAIEFAEGENLSGYIIRQGREGEVNKLAGFFGGFVPCASEESRINRLIGL